MSLGLACLLLWAGLDKLRALPAVGATLGRLGVPDAWARACAVGLAGSEVLLAVGLVFRPGQLFVSTGVTLLATGFAAAGTIALLRRETIVCGCFGPGSVRPLGWTQVMMLPGWLGAVLALQILPPADPDPTTGLLLLAACGLLLATLRGVEALRAAQRARQDRRSALEMLRWLPQ